MKAKTRKRAASLALALLMLFGLLPLEVWAAETDGETRTVEEQTDGARTDGETRTDEVQTDGARTDEEQTEKGPADGVQLEEGPAEEVQAAGTQTGEARTEPAVFSVEDKTASPGERVTVNVSVSGNPGILGAELTLSYDPELTLVDAEAGEAFSALTMTRPGVYASPCKFVWDAMEIVPERIRDGVILTLTFEVSAEVQTGEALSVEVSSITAYDLETNFLEVAARGGTITILDYIPGDVNGDGAVSTLDIILLRRHIVGGYGAEINTAAADVDDDGRQTVRDVIRLRQYLAGGYGVELKPSRGGCSHELTAEPASPATCTETGHIAYWACSLCGRYFSDANGTSEISGDKLVLQPLGHTPVTIPAVAPTHTETGLTEGSRCSVCGEILKAQETVPVLTGNYYSITYHTSINDSYLQQLAIENPNPQSYAGESGLVLQDLLVDGYEFQGWYDGAGDSAVQVKSIPAGSTGNKTLYAHWKQREYVVQFDSPLVPVASKTYTVSRGTTLENPQWDGYTFVGWTDDEANLVTSIAPGTTGDITLHANWTSLRNQTRPVSRLKDPVIYEDYDNNQILFAYEIGTVENIPLYVIKDFGNTNGITVTETITATSSVSSSTAESIANAVSNATTNSASWTLSNEWNETTSYNKSYSDEFGCTEEEGIKIGQSDNKTWNISAGRGGTKSTTTTDGNEWGVSAKISGKVSASTEAKAGVDIEVLSAGGKTTTGMEIGGEIGGNYGESHSVSDTNSRNWNTNVAYQKSSSTSSDYNRSMSLSRKISEQTGYGKSYLQGGSSSSSQGLSTSQTDSREYASSFTYSTAETTTTTRTYSNENAKTGWYRLVCAGTAHVFAVIGYDIASRTYFTYSYSIMDDETHEFLDYSKNTGLYNDYENGVLPFETPYYVNDYVDSIVYASGGLVVDIDTGTILRYNGTDTDVRIPRYMPVDNGDGTVTVVRITGIDSNAFRGNDRIIKVTLSDAISEIPAHAFEGCTALRAIAGGEITSIGERAFAGCAGISGFNVSSAVTALGSRAFEGAPRVTVNAADASVALAAADSGAKQIVLNLSSLSGGLDSETLAIPEGTERFEFNGGGQTFQNLAIASDAAETVINNATLSSSGEIPLRLSSPSVTLNRVNVSAPGFAVRLSANKTVLGLFGTTDISTSGSNAVLSRSLELTWANPNAAGKLNVSGNVLICGTLGGESSLKVNGGQVVYIDEAQYERMLHSFTVYFDPNGGVCGEASRDVAMGTALGVLPVPTRAHHIFDGWYLGDGNRVTESTTLSSGTDLTLLAHWTLKPASGWVLASEAPAGAEIVDEKWTYNQRTNTESYSTSLAGYTQYGSYWVRGGSGSRNYASFPSGFNTGHSIYQNFSTSGYSSYENATSKRVVSNNWAGYVYWHWMYNVAYANVTNRAISSKRATYGSLSYVYFDAFTSSTNCPYLDNYYCNSQNLPSYNCHSVMPSRTGNGKGTPRYFRFDYYTSTYTDYSKMFQYYKIEAKESASPVTASGMVTNVQHWVQYRSV